MGINKINIPKPMFYSFSLKLFMENKGTYRGT